MNLKGCLNYLISLIKHTARIFFFLFLLNGIANAQEEKNDTVYVMHKSPWGAVLRSAVIPGWGQIYNQSYYKAPIVWGVSAWLVYNWIQSNNQYKNYQKFYFQTSDTRYKTQRDFYRDQRDLFSIYMGITYVLTLVDAYVDAHLFDFSVEEEPVTGTSKLNVRVNF